MDYSDPFGSSDKPDEEKEDVTEYGPVVPRKPAAAERTPSPARPRPREPLADDTYTPNSTSRVPGPSERRGQSRDGARRPPPKTLKDSQQDERDEPSLDIAWLGEGAASNNPVVDAARMIFALVVRLRLTNKAPSVTDLRDKLLQHLANFDRSLKRNHVPGDLAQDASYALCSFIDESVMSTPWGTQSDWTNLTLLSQRHKDRHGGEKFFKITSKALGEPSRYIDLLEFLYICLSFGFRGAYGAQRSGHGQLEDLKEKIYREIRSQRGEGERDLSRHWRGVVDKRNPIVRFVPLWVVGAVCAAVLVATFLGFRLTMAAAAAPVEQGLNKIGRDELHLQPQAAPLVVPAGVRRLKSYLENEIAQNLVTVDEFPDKSVARLNSDQCFASGSANVEAVYLPALQRVGTEINHVAGRVEVIGHSDNQPLTSLRFASNLELSRMRADGVVKALAQFGVAAERLSADGRGDAEPLADNATSQGRGKNRRVEIVVYEGVTNLGAGAPAAPSLFNTTPR